MAAQSKSCTNTLKIGIGFSVSILDLSKYSDTYTKELEKLIKSKVKGKPIVAKPIEKVEKTQDLVAALKTSLQQKTDHYDTGFKFAN
jgi:non-homologous end joining protein Ku